MIGGRLGGGGMSRLRRFAFEPFSNWLHILLKLRQLILRGSRSALSIYCLSTAEYRESVPLILRFGTGADTGPGAFLLLPLYPWLCRMLAWPSSWNLKSLQQHVLGKDEDRYGNLI